MLLLPQGKRAMDRVNLVWPILPWQDEGGMTGLLCAVLAGKPEMLRMLVELKADVHSRAWGLGEFGYYDNQTLLMVACKSCQETSSGFR